MNKDILISDPKGVKRERGRRCHALLEDDEGFWFPNKGSDCMFVGLEQFDFWRAPYEDLGEVFPFDDWPLSFLVVRLRHHLRPRFGLAVPRIERRRKEQKLSLRKFRGPCRLERRLPLSTLH